VSRDLSGLSDEYVRDQWASIVARLTPEDRRPSWLQRFLELLGRSAVCWTVPTVPPSLI
jgi:hypothetical protein